ncbi:MAG: rhodanese-like domain-containing protein, partial [Firmicutes bacterium]|nr:rhodanese-like domain-containing protein [Candidatus Gallilactobacillus intestinavium]
MLLLNIIFLVLIIFLVWLIRHYYLLIRCKQSGSIIEEKEFQSGLHKAQVIDLREKKDFD